MLSPSLALRCPQCQRPLTLADVRASATCTACGAAHGVPPHIIDSLALYERAIQQAVADLFGGAGAISPAPSDTPRVGGDPAPDRVAYPMAGAPVPAASEPPATAPVPADTSHVPQASPEAALADLESPAPADSRPGDLAPTVPADSRPDVLAPPVPADRPTARPALPSPLLSGPRLASDTLAAERSAPARPIVDAPAQTRLDGQAPPISVPPTALSTGGRADAELESRPPTQTASNSSLLSLLAAGSSTALSETPLLVAAVREPGPGDTQPVPKLSDLADAVRLVLKDRPAADHEPEGRIPATALAVARRTLLARHADERRSQQVRDGGLGLVVVVAVCIALVVAGLWYAAVALAALALVVRLRREERGERFGAEVQRLADALGGQRLPGYDAIAAWFDALWPAPVSPEAMWTSHLHGAVRSQAGDYAVLVDVHLNEKTAGGVVYPPRITAYLAGIWPSRVPTLRPSATDLPQRAHERLSRLRKAGYTVVADAHGGLVMRASEAIAQAARADITRLPALQVPIGELADLARDLGAEPVPPP